MCAIRNAFLHKEISSSSYGALLKGAMHGVSIEDVYNRLQGEIARMRNEKGQ
jgi:hypothetical protein